MRARACVRVHACVSILKYKSVCEAFRVRDVRISIYLGID